jgi:hypothetical protein
MLASTYKTARGSLVGLRYRLGPPPAMAAAGPRVTLDLRRFHYSRYFYSFVKCLAIEGVGVDLRFRPQTMHALSRAQYGNMVLAERLVSLVASRGRGPWIGDSPGGVGFGTFDFQVSRDPAVYDVPMAQHPLMYARGLWNRPVETGEPRPAVLFIGNSEPGTYSKIDHDGVFDVIGRIRLRELLAKSGLGRDLAAGDDLAAGTAGRVTLVDSSQRPIPMEDFRQTVAGFGFFLCAPGVFMPLCHNLIEAMSVGTIPLIQRSYAALLEPVLEHGRNAIVFDGEADLVERVGEALAMDPDRIGGMKRRVLDYYDAHLSPRAVAQRILRPDLRQVRMLAGERSVNLLRQRQAAGNR